MLLVADLMGHTNTTRGYVQLNPAHGVAPVELISHNERSPTASGDGAAPRPQPGGLGYCQLL